MTGRLNPDGSTTSTCVGHTMMCDRGTIMECTQHPHMPTLPHTPNDTLTVTDQDTKA